MNVPELRVNTVCGAVVNQHSMQQQYTGKYQKNSTPKVAEFGSSIYKFCGGPHNTSRCMDSSIDINQLMRLDVYIRHDSFTTYAVAHIKIASPTCGWTYIYVTGKFKLYRIYEQCTLGSKICYRIRVHLFHDLYIRPTAYGKSSENMSTALTG